MKTKTKNKKDYNRKRKKDKSRDKSNDKSNINNNNNINNVKDYSFDVLNTNLSTNDVLANMNENNLKPWECFSIYTDKRSLDFAAPEEEINKWFYGLKCLFNQIKLTNNNNNGKNEKNINKQICSVSHFRLYRLKMKLFEVLRIEYEEKLIPNKEKYEKEIALINKVLSRASEYGPNYISFSKILLFCLKLKPDLMNKTSNKTVLNVLNNKSNINNLDVSNINLNK